MHIDLFAGKTTLKMGNRKPRTLTSILPLMEAGFYMRKSTGQHYAINLDFGASVT
jgi:hypothetical protein